MGPYALAWALCLALGCGPRGLSAKPGQCSPVWPLEEVGAAWDFDYESPEEGAWWGELAQLVEGPDSYDGVEVQALAQSSAIEHQWGGRDEDESTLWLQCQADGWHLLASHSHRRSWGKSGTKSRHQVDTVYPEAPLVAPARFEVGDTWQVDRRRESTIGDETYELEETLTYEVTGYDKVEVPAGEFHAFVVSVHEVPNEGWSEYWVEDVGVVQGRYTKLRSYE
ncbi:hypothetical protein L6R53_20245 [Myxococcota bacterium]|nr:hypothetical protein [Myxococcota bacterium]